MNENENLVPKRRFKEFINTGTWEQRKLEDLGSFKNGMNFDKSAMGHGHPFINLQNIFGKTVVDDKDLGLAVSSEKQRNEYNLLKGDILFIRSSVKPEGVGEAALVPKNFENTTFSGFIIRFRPHITIDDEFKRVIFATKTVRNQIMALATSSANTNINQISLGKIIIELPELSEQSKIGNLFKQLDNAIALHQQKQRQIRSLKQGFIKNLFPNNKNSAPRIRFSIFNDDWNQRNASEIFTSVSDKNYPELPVLSASQEKGMVLRESNGIDIKYDQKSTGTYKRVLPGQFVMHLRSFQGGFAYSTIEGITSPAYTILAFRNKEDHYPLFWKSIFSSKNFIKRLEAITYGIRDGRSISYADFSTLRFWIPSYEEQKQIGDFIESIDATIAFYQRQIDMMQSLKKELLNKMFI